jgi:hypothetical protein
MKRRLLDLLTALSLLLCVGVAVLWVRSHYGSENVISSVRVRGEDWRYWEMTDAGVALRPGVMLIGRASEWVGSAAETPPTCGSEPAAPQAGRERFAGRRHVVNDKDQPHLVPVIDSVRRTTKKGSGPGGPVRS